MYKNRQTLIYPNEYIGYHRIYIYSNVNTIFIYYIHMYIYMCVCVHIISHIFIHIYIS
jgi:hypothetical protein